LEPSEIVYTSEVVEDNLNPVWKTASLDIAALIEDGNLDTPIRIKINDKDKGGVKSYIGDLMTSVNHLMKVKSERKPVNLYMFEDDVGRLGVDIAELVDYKDWKWESTKLLSEAKEMRSVFERKAKQAKAAAEEAKSLAAQAKDALDGLAVA